MCVCEFVGEWRPSLSVVTESLPVRLRKGPHCQPLAHGPLVFQALTTRKCMPTAAHALAHTRGGLFFDVVTVNIGLFTDVTGGNFPPPAGPRGLTNLS